MSMQWATTVECKECHFKMIENHQGWGDCDPVYHEYMTGDSCPVCKKVKEVLEGAKNTEQLIAPDKNTCR